MTPTPQVRVLFIQSQPFFGADSRIHADLMRHFDREAVEVHVACTSRLMSNPATSAALQIQSIPDVHIRPTNFPLSSDASLSRRRQLADAPRAASELLALARYVRRHRIDIIHGTEKPRDACTAVLLAKLTGAKSLVQMHVSYQEWLSPPVRLALRHADAIVGVSDFTARSIVDAGFSPHRVHTVHNSLNLDGWVPGAQREETRRALGIDADAPVVGIISRLFRWKGHRELIDAFASVRDRVSGARLVIVGADDVRANAGGGYRTELEAQVERLGLKGCVLFTGFRTDVPQLMAAFDVFAHPSWEEPFGMVFLEAMAMKRPVVAWASGGAPEVIVDGETGLLAERGSIPSLAAGIIRLLQDSALSARFGEAGRRRVEQIFTPARMSGRMLDVYRTTRGR